MALTGKKRAFADAVLAGRSNKDAAIVAGYSPATASAAGSRLVKDPGRGRVLEGSTRHHRPWCTGGTAASRAAGAPHVRFEPRAAAHGPENVPDGGDERYQAR